MPKELLIHQNHFFWRAAFGPSPDTINEAIPFNPASHYKALYTASFRKPDMIKVTSNSFDGLMKGINEAVRVEQLTKEEKKALQRQSRQDLKNLNLLWLDEMINNTAQLREKMAFFWHGHFACRIINIYFQQDLLQIIRENALGNFGDMLRAVSKSPAMLSFLNNQQNKKQHPNENFAREVMELFTLGRGNYSEQDIKEAARAFTGWGFGLNGAFTERPFQHDNGFKTIFGKTGNFNGDDVINMLLENKQTAKYITNKIYKFFVNENVDNEKCIWLAERFYQNGYNIETLMKDIFTASWFYDKKNIANKIKSPVELLVGIRRLLPMQIENPEIQLLFQKILNQVLFYPPNVAGWPGGKAWIDSSSLIYRMRIPQIIAKMEALQINMKSDDDKEMGKMQTNIPLKMQINAQINWQRAILPFSNIPRNELFDNLVKNILLKENLHTKKIIENYIDNSSKENYIKTTMLQLMSTPEYQLC